MPRTNPSDDTISVTTSPQPPWRFTRRRNAVSVMPAIGATPYGAGSSIDPIFITRMGGSVLSHVGRVHLDADRLADEIDGEDQARLVVLSHESANDTAQRPVAHFDHHALADHRAGIIGEIALDQSPNTVDLPFRDRRRLAFERYNVDDTGALEYRQAFARIEPREAVAREQRPVDLLLPVFPAAPAGDGREEGLDVL